jgi:RNA polymerase sigma-70 factor (ECF subfamily)
VATSKQEVQWVLRVQCGDQEALELLLRGVQPLLHRFLRGRAGPDLADDVLQEVLLIICRKLAWLREPAVFRAWAYRIASREAFRRLKKQRRLLEEPSEESALEEIPATAIPADAVAEHVNLDGVPPASRAVLTLHFLEEMTLPEVAVVLEIPLGTVKSRLAYGWNVIRKQLEKTGRER